MVQDAYQKPPVDPLHWDKLSRFHPVDVCNRTEALYHPTKEGYILPVYHLRYLILPKTREILRVDCNDEPVEEGLHPFFTLMVLVYLNEAKEIGPSHQWVSEKDLKGGINFFQGPHSLQVRELEGLYGKDPEAFFKAGKRLSGTEIFYGDKAFVLEVFPRIPLAYLLWEGSEEFPPKIRVLFDSTIQSHLPLDVIWGMVAETSRRLAEPTIL